MTFFAKNKKQCRRTNYFAFRQTLSLFIHQQLEMNENSSSLDLNTLWVEYKNPDGRVSCVIESVCRKNSNFFY